MLGSGQHEYCQEPEESLRDRTSRPAPPAGKGAAGPRDSASGFTDRAEEAVWQGRLSVREGQAPRSVLVPVDARRGRDAPGLCATGLVGQGAGSGGELSAGPGGAEGGGGDQPGTVAAPGGPVVAGAWASNVAFGECPGGCGAAGQHAGGLSHSLGAGGCR